MTDSNKGKKPLLPSYNVNAFAILALVMGIVAIATIVNTSTTVMTAAGNLTGSLGPSANWPVGILAIVFSRMASKRLQSDDQLGAKFTKAGFVMGIIAVISGIIVSISAVVDGLRLWETFLS